MSREDTTDAVAAAVHPKISERLFEARTVLIHGEVTSRLAHDVTAQAGAR